MLFRHTLNRASKQPAQCVQRPSSTLQAHPVECFIAFLILFSLVFALRCPTWKTGDQILMSEADIDDTVSECPWRPRPDHQSSWVAPYKPPCPSAPTSFPSSFPVRTEANATLIQELSKSVERGGRWTPRACNSAHFVAVVVPYRDRSEHLSLFLQHLHPFLQTQQLQYAVFVVEQSSRHAFNRGKLFNIGFTEALKQDSYCCFVFHDVDLLPEDPRNMYRCESQPRHLSSAINVFRYVLPYPDIFGGVVSMRADHFRRINGFSNRFFGWGGEDDDLRRRIDHAGLRVCRWPMSISRYVMLEHAKATPNPHRRFLLDNGRDRFGQDGLSDLHYRVLKLEELP